MVRSSDFHLVGVQATIFTPERSAFVQSKFIASVLKKYADRYEGDMEALPLPEGVPAEVPRVILNSSDKTWRLEAAPARINSFWQKPDGEQPRLAEAASRCSEVLEYYVRENAVAVGRLALVVTRICKVENPAQVLIERFCSLEARQEPLNRSATFEIHNHKQYSPAHAQLKLTINSWVRCKTAVVVQDKSPAVLVEQDLNTLAEEVEKLRFDADQIRKYFELAAGETDDILRKYFPG